MRTTSLIGVSKLRIEIGKVGNDYRFGSTFEFIKNPALDMIADLTEQCCSVDHFTDHKEE